LNFTSSLMSPKIDEVLIVTASPSPDPTIT
jgi:hypothetical protein